MGHEAHYKVKRCAGNRAGATTQGNKMKLLGSGNELHTNGATVCEAMQAWLNSTTRDMDGEVKVVDVKFSNGPGAAGATYIFTIEPLHKA